ncbi:YceI family protein [Flagellimonas pacifica]|uniref:Polyisoprenoid-binding protein YceI n=1 Tax=Flagellimonas pacifica TaxID=1247520 RepID=A0A285MD85_9FLAO|nr:YceI family protein [Allomuricauda parva]SNY95099.1 Polyisoprenoid-binding protein YceI [Allomuricauda parva]
MKKIIILLVGICTLTAAYGQGTIKIDTAKSVIKWKGSNLFKFNQHYGTVKFLSGEISMAGPANFPSVEISNNKPKIAGGKFVVDMNSILNTDGKYNEMLVSHLKNKDFFDVEKYPVAQLNISEAKYIDGKQMDVEALLTIKGITKPVKFKMTIEQQGKIYELKSRFVIDRTRWGISYESQGLVGSLKEDIISDAIEFEVIIVFRLLC